MKKIYRYIYLARVSRITKVSKASGYVLDNQASIPGMFTASILVPVTISLLSG